MRVCVSAGAVNDSRTEAALINVTLGRGAVRAAASTTDSIVSAPRVLLWPLSERAAHNYGHLLNSVIVMFAAARDAGFVQQSDAANAHRGWRFDPEVVVVVDASGPRTLLPRFEAIARVFFPTLRLLFDELPRKSGVERCVRLPETVYGGGAAGMGNFWDYYADAGLRLRPTGERTSPHLPPRRWRAGEVVPAFQQYARAILAVPLPRFGPMPADRPRMHVLIEQRRATGMRGEGRAARRISNVDELVGLGAELDASSSAFSVEVRAIEFGALPLRTVAALVSSAAALVGVEGSGLANAIFLSPGGALVTIKPPPQCHSDAFDANDSHTLADKRDPERAPHSNGQMFGYYGSFEKLALALEGPIHLLPLCLGKEDVQMRWANSPLTRKYVEKGWTDKYGAPRLTSRSYASSAKVMRHMWYLSAVHSVRVEPELFRGVLHALHSIWGADQLQAPLIGGLARGWVRAAG
jgi:hypothetical protein